MLLSSKNDFKNAKRTYQDRREYLIKAVSERRRRIKQKALAYMGNKCQICGYQRYHGALDFHHLDPLQKSFSIGLKGHSRSWKRVKEELNKCILLCANCHREVGDSIVVIDSTFTQLSQSVTIDPVIPE